MNQFVCDECNLTTTIFARYVDAYVYCPKCGNPKYVSITDDDFEALKLKYEDVQIDFDENWDE